MYTSLLPDFHFWPPPCCLPAAAEGAALLPFLQWSDSLRGESKRGGQSRHLIPRRGHCARSPSSPREAETPKPARQEGAPHLDLAAPCLASSFSPARSSCRSSRPLPALPPPSSPRTSPSERTERGAEDERRCSFVLSPFSRGGAGATATEQQGTAREPTTGRRARRLIATPATYGASSAEREGTTMSRRGRAASEGRGRRCNRATGNRQPPFHTFLHLHTCAFSLNSSACFL